MIRIAPDEARFFYRRADKWIQELHVRSSSEYEVLKKEAKDTNFVVVLASIDLKKL
ncbi:hypothetical protein EG328_008165 [Venturia inaequalis]|uniref:Uncharacterized protein n=1 Tax=Venturia inaequalis TaxID=5025 RepID=A0A8H3YPR3_VENIN|nr:hypothetical protein EG328_008165 [Venturia inaequalis]